jgi:hypothetical protein
MFLLFGENKTWRRQEEVKIKTKVGASGAACTSSYVLKLNTKAINTPLSSIILLLNK